jgi:hypothetical protein
VLVLAASAAARPRGPHVRLLLLLAAVFLVLSLGPVLVVQGHAVMPLPYRLLHEHVPLLRAGRHPVTFVIGAVLALGVLAGLGLSALRLAVPVRALVLGLAFLETVAPSPKRVDRGMLPEAYGWLAAHGAQAVAELPYDQDAPQFWAAFHGLCTTAGISPYSPAEHMGLAQRVSHEWKHEGAAPGLEGTVSLAFFKRHIPVTHLLVNPGRPPGMVREIEATPSQFTSLQESSVGELIYVVGRGGLGPLIRRSFRDDQLRGATLVVRIRAPAGAPARVRLNGTELARTTGGAADLSLAPPESLLRRGANEVEVAALDGSTPVELLDIGVRPARTEPCR